MSLSFFPIRLVFSDLQSDCVMECYRSSVEQFLDERASENVQCSVADVAVEVFSVVFIETRSFLEL